MTDDRKPILIIEDDNFISDLYCIVFKKKGYEVQIAKDGQEGLDMAKAILPSIILMDVMMPKMNGIEVLERLKADEVTHAIPVVALTNMAEPTVSKTVMEKGAIKYMIKSQYLPDEIVSTIENILHELSQNPPK